MDLVIPKDVEKLPFCIQQIIKNRNISVVDTDRAHIISIAYRYMKSTNVRTSVHSEIITCLNNSFTNPLKPDEIMNIINNILATGKIVKPTCDEMKTNQSLKHICQNYGTQCPQSRTLKIEALKDEIKATVSNIIPNTKSVQMLKGTPTYYIIEFRDGNTFQIVDEQLLRGSQNFRVWYANTYRKVLTISKDEWLEIVQSWLEMADETEQEELSEDEVIKEIVLNKLRNSVHVSSFDEVIKREGRIYIENGKAYIYNNHLIKMIEREGIKVSYQRLRLILYSYLAEQTKVVKIGDNSFRFWVFSVNKVNIPVREIISDIEAEHDDTAHEEEGSSDAGRSEITDDEADEEHEKEEMDEEEKDEENDPNQEDIDEERWYNDDFNY